MDIERVLSDGSVPDFITKIDNTEWIIEVKNFPGYSEWPEFLKDKLFHQPGTQYAKYSKYGPTKLVFITKVPQSFIDGLVKRYKVPIENIINGV